MIGSSRLFLRRALAATAAGQSATGATSGVKTTKAVSTTMLARAVSTTATGMHSPTTRRLFGTPANQTQMADASPADGQASVPCYHKYDKLVEKSIKKLMTINRDDTPEEKRLISNEDLEARLSYFQKVFEEAELCLSDLRETLFLVDDEQYQEECTCAKGSLNNAFVSYIDLLEDFRRSTEEQLHTYSEQRNIYANKLKRLRKELDQIVEVANDRDLAST